jgi:hypothetical protein
MTPVSEVADLLKNELLAPIGSQEIWAAGGTYMQSKSVRIEE